MGFELKRRGNMHTGCSGLNHLNFLFGSFFCSQGHELLWIGLVLLYLSRLYFRDLDVAYVYFSVGKRAVPRDTMRVLLSAFWDEAPRDGCHILTQPS